MQIAAAAALDRAGAAVDDDRDPPRARRRRRRQAARVGRRAERRPADGGDRGRRARARLPRHRCAVPAPVADDGRPGRGHAPHLGRRGPLRGGGPGRAAAGAAGWPTALRGPDGAEGDRPCRALGRRGRRRVHARRQPRAVRRRVRDDPRRVEGRGSRHGTPSLVEHLVHARARCRGAPARLHLRLHEAVRRRRGEVHGRERRVLHARGAAGRAPDTRRKRARTSSSSSPRPRIPTSSTAPATRSGSERSGRLGIQRVAASLTIEPFRLEVGDDELDDLRSRLARTRFPNEVAGVGWEQGTELSYLRELVAYWLDGYDWRAAEARLDGFDHFIDRGRRAAHPLRARPLARARRAPAGPEPRLAGIGRRVPRRDRPA